MAEEKRYKRIHNDKEIDGLIHDGERILHVCSLHKEAFMKTMATLDMIVPTFIDLLGKEKSFRAELYYDAEADNVELLTFVKSDTKQYGSGRM